ncbi:MAG: ribulose 1,5-bisphosphate carboxylase [Deltaproteobacteria bacterium]|nr:ribulose 1,5-bisphosphate carboxylase [Deltaproteobacteria bacterium]
MLSEEDIPHFFADPQKIKLDEYVTFTYLFETEINPKLAAAQLCSEQSTAQWARPGVQEDYRPEFAAKVIDLTPLPQGERGRIFEVVVAHPHKNFEAKIPNILSAAAGEGPFYCPGITYIKWIDFDAPASFLNQFEGPQFGVKALRDLLKVYERPFFIGVVKPNIGLAPQDFADIAYEAWMGGLDIAKDDEMLADVAWSPLQERTRACAKLCKQAEKETGHPKIYLASITDEVDQMLRLHDVAVREGAGMVMINTIWMGPSALRMLRRYSKVPLVSHFTGMAALSRMPNFGISSLVYTKLQRLAGADIIVLAGFGPRMHTSEQEVIANTQACLKPWGKLKAALPVPGGSDWAGTLPSIYQKLGHMDFGLIPGRGVFSHPAGPRAGAQSLHQAWEAIIEKKSLEEKAKENGCRALDEALKEWPSPAIFKKSHTISTFHTE